MQNKIIDGVLTVNGKKYTVVRLLGKGKGGYSYLATDGRREFTVKQIHHEPCEYYSFGYKLRAELSDYARIKAAGVRMPELIDADNDSERIVKEYIRGETAMALVKDDRAARRAVRTSSAHVGNLQGGGHKSRLVSDQLYRLRRRAVLY